VPRLPAFCTSCGHAFPSPIEVNNASNIHIRDVATNCPRCGATARIPDGIYSALGSVVEILAGPTRSIERIQRIQQILKEAQRKQQSREEVQSKIASTAPELSSFTSTLPATRVELYAFITVLLTLLTLLVTAYGTLKPSGPTQAEIESMVSKAIEKSGATPGSPKANPQKKRVVPKVGRNEACSCGSGKKFKRCCLAAAG
jgi:hypothetical protein